MTNQDSNVEVQNDCRALVFFKSTVISGDEQNLVMNDVGAGA